MKFLYSLLLCFSFAAAANAQWNIIRREATVISLDTKNQFAGFLIDAKARTTNAEPDRYNVRVIDGCVFRMLPSRRKVQGTFTDLQVGQRVLLSGNRSISGNFASEITILPAKDK